MLNELYDLIPIVKNKAGVISYLKLLILMLLTVYIKLLIRFFELYLLSSVIYAL